MKHQRPDGKSVVRSGDIKALTGLRIVAAVWVVLFHFRPLLRDAAPGFRDALAPVLNCGAQGVDLFFILSGFVLTWNYLDRMGWSWSTRSTLHFLWLRLARVWPVYLVTLHLAALWVIFTLHVGHVPWQDLSGFSAVSYVRQVLLVQLWFQPFFDGSSWDGPAWSISAEWLAYVLFPLAALLFFRLRRWPRWLLAGLAVLLMAPESILCLRTGSPYFPFSWAARILTGFTAGVLIYLVVRDIVRTDRVRRIASWLSWLLVAAVLGGLWFGAWLGVAPEGTERGGVVLVLFPLLVGALSLAGGSRVGVDRLLSTRWAVHGGRISYSLYLVHVPLFEVFWAVMERIPAFHADGLLATVLTPVVFLAAFGIAHLLYSLVEEPSRRVLRRSSRPTSGPRAVPPKAVGAPPA